MRPERLQLLHAPTQKDGPRLSFLDSLRGIAALYVVVFHAALVPLPPLGIPSPLREIIMFGGSGVTLFFVISAFSLTLRMPKHAQSGGFLTYYTHRLFRIAPLFYVILFLTLVRDYYILGIYHSEWSIISSLFFVFNFISGWQAGIVWASWTIGVEMAFYVIFPFMYLIASDLTKKMALLCFTILIYLTLPAILLAQGFDQKSIDLYKTYSLMQLLPIFVIGMMSFDLYERIKLKNNKLLWGYSLISFGLAGLLLMILNKIPVGVLDGRHIQAVFYTLMLLGASVLPTKLLVNDVFSFYGKISYSVYLWHAPLIFASSPVFRYIYGFGFWDSISYFICIVFTIAVVTPISFLTYKYIEKPGIDLGNRLLQRYKVGS